MKKVLVGLGLMTGILFFSACGAIEGEFKSDPELLSYTGILNEQAPTDTEPGSHFLITESGEKLSLRSIAINLSSDDYLANKVQINALFIDKENVLEVTGISVQEVLSQKTEKSRFVEYKNTKKGFQLKYYDNWLLDDTDNISFSSRISEGSNGQAVVDIEQLEFTSQTETGSDGLEGTPLLAYYTQTFGDPADKDVFHKIGVDKIDAMQNISDGVITYVLYRPGYIYSIKFSPADPEKGDDEIKFKQMLSEFRFIAFDTNVSPEAENDAPEVNHLPLLDLILTDFESLPYSFSGKYPAKWYYAGMKGTKDSVLHHYGFSDQPLTSDNEIISLDILAISIPDLKMTTFNDKEFVIQESASIYKVYVAVGGQNYLVSSPIAYKDLALNMAANISSTEDMPAE